MYKIHILNEDTFAHQPAAYLILLKTQHIHTVARFQTIYTTATMMKMDTCGCLGYRVYYTLAWVIKLLTLLVLRTLDI